MLIPGLYKYLAYKKLIDFWLFRSESFLISHVMEIWFKEHFQRNADMRHQRLFSVLFLMCLI